MECNVKLNLEEIHNNVTGGPVLRLCNEAMSTY
jgi:hypothetical protein